jgi:hypothetical protein
MAAAGLARALANRKAPRRPPNGRPIEQKNQLFPEKREEPQWLSERWKKQQNCDAYQRTTSPFRYD